MTDAVVLVVNEYVRLLRIEKQHAAAMKVIAEFRKPSASCGNPEVENMRWNMLAVIESALTGEPKE